MASIQDIESASAFGALDGDAIVDGRAIDAKVLRSLGMQANRLIAQGQQAFNLVWPQVTQSIEGLTQYSAEWAMPSDWRLLLPPVPVQKMPGLVTGTVHFKANIPTGAIGLFAIETGAETGGRRERVGSFVGTGALADYSIANVRFLPGASDEVRIYHMTGDPQGSLMATGTYGTPAEATLGAATVDTLTNFSMTDAGAAWSTSPSIASGSHRLLLISDYGGTGEQVVYEAAITWNTATIIGWSVSGLPVPTRPDYGPEWPLDRLIAQWRTGRATRYQIRTALKFNLSQVLCVLDARAL